ncbi:MAG: hypothetical protein HC795_04755 [Coleofasciculaceae cyanobacterium RL_1_1]|nr:hypothetical protein [Coleofasciculaceae cyanobacterium RL_1_1]
MMLTLMSCTLGFSLAVRSMKILFDRYTEEHKYHASNPQFSAEDFLCGRSRPE